MWISQKTLCLPVLASFADSKLLDFSDPGQLTLHINRTLCVSRYIQDSPNIRMCKGYEGGVWERDRDCYVRPSVLNASSIYGSPSEVCVIIELIVFRGLSGDNASSTYLVIYHAVQRFM